MPFTLYFYIARRYAACLLITLMTVMLAMWLFDAIELMRIASHRLTTTSICQMALLKNYDHVQRILPLISFLSGLLFYSNLARTYELLMCRVIGMSIWQILLPPVTISILFSLLYMSVLNPIGTSMLTRYEHLEANELKGHTSLLSVAPKGIWLRQYSEQPEQMFIIHAKRIDQSEHELFDVAVFVLNKDGHFVERIEATSAKLLEEGLKLSELLITTFNYEEKRLHSMTIPTHLSFAQLQDSITPPETVPFLKLPTFIAEAQDAGFPVLRHRLYFYRLLSMPLFFVAMTLLSAGFIKLTPRQGKAGITMARGILAVLLIHFASDIINAFGTSGAINLVLAAVAPAILCMLLGCYMLLHYEEH